MLGFLGPILLKWVKDPRIWAIIGLTILSGFLYVKIQWMKADIADLKTDIEKQKTAITTLHTEKRQCFDARTLQKETIENLGNTIAGLKEQVKKERSAISFWKEQHDKKSKLLSEATEVLAEDYIEEGKVVDEKSSDRFVDYFNDTFDRMRKERSAGRSNETNNSSE